MAVLHYGDNSVVELAFAAGVEPIQCGVPLAEALTDVAAATQATLHEPIEYPPLAASLTPSDRIAIVLDSGAPKIAEILAAIVQTLMDAGIEPENITVLQTQPELSAESLDPCQLVPAPLRERLTLAMHDPNDRRQMAYLAADEAGEAILVNRALHEADVVLPIARLRADDAAGYFGIHSVVYPAFSDAKTIRRFRSIGTLNGQDAHNRELAAQVDHVALTLGVFFTIQLVPAAGGGLLHVLSGASESVRRRGRQLYREAWHCPGVTRAELVVAAIEGDAGQQTWENVGQAIQAAGHFVEEDGSIAVCCELAAPPGPALQRMAGSSSREATLRHVAKDRPIDVLPAAQLAQAQQRYKLYLLSRLDPAMVEDLEIVPIADPDELRRLVGRCRSCVLLANAPYVTIAE